MPEFPHLPLPTKLSGAYKNPKRRFDRKISSITSDNLKNRVQHGKTLRQNADKAIKDWNGSLLSRKELNLPALPSESTPIFLQIDIKEFDAETLYAFGIEIISEEEDGFIIGASTDNFQSLKGKINDFIVTKGQYKNKTAQLWNIITGTQWKIDYVLSEDLKNRWEDIKPGDILTVDISVACALKIPSQPQKKKNESANSY